MGTQDNAVTKWVRVAQVLTATVAVTAIPWCVWVTNRIHAMDITVTKLESFASVGGRFTVDNGHALRLEMQHYTTIEASNLWKELASTKTQWLKEIADLNTRIAMLPQTLQIPPKWWEDYVKNEFDKVDRRMTAIEIKVVQ